MKKIFQNESNSINDDSFNDDSTLLIYLVYYLVHFALFTENDPIFAIKLTKTNKIIPTPQITNNLNYYLYTGMEML